MFLKTCIFWKCFKNAIQVVGFRRWNHYKTSHFSSHAISPREYWWFPSRKRPLSEKWYFRDVETESVQSYHIECAELSHRARDPSENHANTIGKRDVFENGAVARMFSRFRALKTVEIHCFLSSPTWNWNRISINLRILVRSKKNGSLVLRGRFWLDFKRFLSAFHRVGLVS